jgi:hypothetical protein
MNALLTMVVLGLMVAGVVALVFVLHDIHCTIHRCPYFKKHKHS